MVLTVPMTSESRIKLALRVLRAISVDHRLPELSDMQALRSLPSARAGSSLDEIACRVIVEEAQRMRIAAEQNACEALAESGVRPLPDCA